MSWTYWGAVVGAAALLGCEVEEGRMTPYGWTRVPSGVTKSLHALAVLDSQTAWAVGDGTTTRWNGVEWAAVPAPRGRLTRARIGGRQNVWALTGDSYPDAFRYDGDRWSEVLHDNGSVQVHIEDVLPLGNDRAIWATLRGVWEWNGSTATALTGEDLSFIFVGGSSRSNFWVVEIGEWSGPSNAGGRVFHFDGAVLRDQTPAGIPQGWRWRDMETARDGTPWLRGDDAIGAATYTRRGQTWERVPDPPGHPLGLWALSSEEAYVSSSDGGIFKYGFGAWTESLPQDSRAVSLMGIGGSSATDVWAVGSEGIIVRLDTSVPPE